MLRSARRSAAAAAEIEQEHAGDRGSPHGEESLDHVVTAVIGSATFLEAMINELFTDAFENYGLTDDGYLAPLDERVVELMATWWDETRQGSSGSALSKYQLLLSFAGAERMDRGSEPFQGAALLVRLRNSIAHYKPATVFADEQHELERALRGRFPPNGLLRDGSDTSWPLGILGAGCANWAVSSAMALADETARRIGIEPNYQRVLRSQT